MPPRYRLKLRHGHEAAIQAALEWLLKRGTWTEEGRYSITGVTSEDIGARHALYAAIQGEVDVPHHVKQRIATEAIAGWYRTSRDPANVESFRRALTDAAHSIEKQSEPFTVLTLWNLKPTAEKVAFQANGLTTTIGSWSEAEGLPLQKVWEDTVRFWYSGHPRWLFQDGDEWFPVMALRPGITAVEAPDWFAAVELVSHSHDLIRACLHLPRTIGLSLGWSRLPQPIGDVLQSPVWAVFGKDREQPQVAHTLEVLHDVKAVDLPEPSVTAAKALLEEVDESASNPEVARFKSKLLRLYQAALDSTDRQSQFLSFWQVLEAATLIEPGSREQVESRLTTLLGFSTGSVNAHLVATMATLRHDLVHRGTYPVADIELPRVLNWIADWALLRTFALLNALGGVNELRSYLQLATRGTTDLKRLTKVAEYILRSPQHAEEEETS
jgi:hypothetical protein